MKKNRIGSGSISIMLFVVAIVCLVATFIEMGQHIELVVDNNGSVAVKTWNTVCALWNTSLYFKYALVALVASNVIGYPIGILLTAVASIGASLLLVIPATELFASVFLRVCLFVMVLDCFLAMLYIASVCIALASLSVVSRFK